MNGAAAIGTLWIGDSRCEFAAARDCLAALPHVSVVERADSSSAAAWLADQAAAPELVVVCQSRPGEIAHAQIDHLRRLAPFSRLVGLLGSWCEGEARSGYPWPAVERIYWHQWPAWINRELGGNKGSADGWVLPLTAAPEERWLAENRGTRESAVSGLVAILSPHPATSELLRDACGQVGLSAVCFDRAPEHVTGAVLAVWDGDRCGNAEAAQLGAFVAAVRPAPVAALLAFPRIEERSSALAAGAKDVFSKPACLKQLLAHVICPAVDRTGTLGCGLS
jgi:hypothetical protein